MWRERCLRRERESDSRRFYLFLIYFLCNRNQKWQTWLNDNYFMRQQRYLLVLLLFVCQRVLGVSTDMTGTEKVSEEGEERRERESSCFYFFSAILPHFSLIVSSLSLLSNAVVWHVKRFPSPSAATVVVFLSKVMCVCLSESTMRVTTFSFVCCCCSLRFLHVVLCLLFSHFSWLYTCLSLIRSVSQSFSLEWEIIIRMKSSRRFPLPQQLKSREGEKEASPTDSICLPWLTGQTCLPLNRGGVDETREGNTRKMNMRERETGQQ